MRPKFFDPDAIVEFYQMPYHLAFAFKSICDAATADTPEEKLRLMGTAQEHVDNELIRLRTVLQKSAAVAPQPERFFGAVLDPDFGLIEEALAEAYQIRESLRIQKEGRKK